MPASPPDPIVRQSRLIRRIGRLFRLERAGAFARRSSQTAWRLIARRSELTAELSRIERQRRQAGVPASPDLTDAVNELAAEVALSRTYGETLVAGLDDELRARRGETARSGLRDGGGRLLGRG